MATKTNQRVLGSLSWMIQTMQFHQRENDPNPEWGLDPSWSPEMLAAMAVYEDIKSGKIVCIEVS